MNASVSTVSTLTTSLADNLEKVIYGKRHQIRLILIALLCGGHVLLDDIPGIGTKRKIQILRTFGSVAALRKVSPEEMAEKIPGLGLRLAEKISESLR